MASTVARCWGRAVCGTILVWCECEASEAHSEESQKRQPLCRLKQGVEYAVAPPADDQHAKLMALHEAGGNEITMYRS